MPRWQNTKFVSKVLFGWRTDGSSAFDFERLFDTMSEIITIERQILEQQRRFPEATGAFSSLLYDMALIAKMIARLATRHRPTAGVKVR